MLGVCFWRLDDDDDDELEEATWDDELMDLMAGRPSPSGSANPPG